ncbi:alpha/beta hydrolase [Knoellia subterranea]|uniref:Alpha/beta hydrolase n=1 Tax=Knoellia subterranea KCTC 19937 TaxID=1385521 RepID=A0A0A0JNC8_9MICO|nr:alpha/beta hydrolase [Knoellia subterranea]KGN37522.1 alpha/beta hydrolase [Knoellia subterranea KCTC 19937]
MESSTVAISAADGTPLHTYRWLPDGPPRGIVQIAHGMAEHAARYERFAHALTGAGYAVYANDHRGHGQTASSADHGYFADRDGFATVVADMGSVSEFAQAEHPGVPLVLFGHSMGSFLSRAYAAQHGARLAGLVLSGTAGDPGPLAAVGKRVAGLQARVRGRHHPSGLMDKLTFGQFNGAFKPNRTAFDWLSRDEDEVDKYIADPLCGNVFTSAFFVDLLGGLQQINSAGAFAAVPRDLPILVMSGELDPVGEDTKGPIGVADKFRKAGVSDVTTTIYPQARHEILNETNRDEVTADVLGWLEERIPTRD